MYARMTNMQVQPNRTEAAMRIFLEHVLPMAKKQHGFINLAMLSDNYAGKVVAISYWQTEDDLLASESVGYYEEQNVHNHHQRTESARETCRCVAGSPTA